MIIFNNQDGGTVNLLDYSDYKKFLKQHLRLHKAQRGYQAALARACGCQPSYLSQVMTGKSHLTEDHAAEMARFLGMDAPQTDYLLCLVRMARAGSPYLKSVLKERAEEAKHRHEILHERLSKTNKPKKELESFYYTSWYWSAIHVATSIQEYQTPKALADRFCLPIGKVNEVLAKLETIGFVEHKNGLWKYKSGEAHLPKDSRLAELNHMHWRHRALGDVQVASEDSLHYTSVVVMTKEDSKKIRELMIQWIANSREISDPSDCEEVYCLNLDLFKA